MVVAELRSTQHLVVQEQQTPTLYCGSAGLNAGTGPGVPSADIGAAAAAAASAASFAVVIQFSDSRACSSMTSHLRHRAQLCLFLLLLSWPHTLLSTPAGKQQAIAVMIDLFLLYAPGVDVEIPAGATKSKGRTA